MITPEKNIMADENNSVELQLINTLSEVPAPIVPVKEEVLPVVPKDGPAQTIRRIDNAILPPLLPTGPAQAIRTIDNATILQQAELAANTPQNISVVDQEPLSPVYSFGTELEALANRGASVSGTTTASGNPAVQTGINQSKMTGGNVSEMPFPVVPDWRFRISLAAGSNYFYNAKNENGITDGILGPLAATNGVVFPYTPSISVTYSANYEQTELPHSNYRMYNYKNSAVENITITADFTAQDTAEANYLLAVIHFFRSATKMFYGKDQNPTAGTPPPLCYLTGYGDYAFDHHPVVISSFTLTYPTDVDYINAGPDIIGSTSSVYVEQSPSSVSSTRLYAAKLRPGAQTPSPGFTQSAKLPSSTRVPTKITIQLGCHAIATRDNVSNNFSLRDYASGKLMRSNNNNSNGGMW